MPEPETRGLPSPKSTFHEVMSPSGSAAARYSVTGALTCGCAEEAVTEAVGALGGGALGYSVFWMWAGFIAPGLGSTGAAKESLRWLAMPSAGALMLATAGVAFLCIRAMTGERNRRTRPKVESGR